MVAVVQTMEPEFVLMQLADVASVLEIENRAYEFPWTEGIFSDCLKTDYILWTLRLGAKIVGYGVISIAAGEAHILNLCIDPKEQGRGLGRRMLKRLVDVARWHGAAQILLEVRPSNKSAMQLYESAGFNHIGTRPKYYPARNGREDSNIMAMELLPDCAEELLSQPHVRNIKLK